MSHSEIIIVPVNVDKEGTLFVELENKYGPSWDIPQEIAELSVSRMIQAITRLAASMVKDRNVKSATIEFAVSAQIEERSLKVFVARSTTPYLLKCIIEAQKSTADSVDESGE
jgi:hypothetical protein